MKKITLFASLCIFAVVSCSKPEVVETAYGSLEMNVSISDRTKAQTEDELYNTAVVNIYKKDFSGLVRSYPYVEMPSPFYLAVGDYRVDVLAGECVAQNPAAASWENKSYKGTAEFSIIEGEPQSVQVLACVNNAVTNVTLDQTVVENFNAGYTLTIGIDGADASAQLVYDASKSGSDGYFIVTGLIEPSFKWTFSGVLAKDGSAFTKSGTVSGVEAGKLYKMNLKYTIKDGDIDFSLSVDKTTDIFDDTIIFEPVSTGLATSSPFEIWAAHATLHADIDDSDAEGATIQFAYSSNDSDWTYVDAVVNPDGGWKADVNKLTPSTTYSYKLVINDEQIGDPLTFTTEAAPNLPNASFEYVSKVSGTDYYKFYDPNCGVEEGMSMFWGSGNGEGKEGVDGSGDKGIIITKVETGDKIHGNQSVLAHTSSLVGFLAAGNLFTGQFAGLVGTSGGKVNFGRPWTSRPSALRVWCKYETDKMDIINNQPPGMNLTKNDYDRAQVKVALGTWDYKTYGGTKDSPVHVNTTNSDTFVDFNTDRSTIANGDLIIYNDGYSVSGGAKVSGATSGWIQYTIPIAYRNLNSYPTHIVVSFAASQYGDYFTGNDGSKLWIDQVELIYE